MKRAGAASRNVAAACALPVATLVATLVAGCAAHATDKTTPPAHRATVTHAAPPTDAPAPAFAQIADISQFR